MMQEIQSKMSHLIRVGVSGIPRVTAYSPPSVTMSDDEKWALVRSDRDSRLQ